eukprot:TRINITY_DN26917_c0_g1_i1.p1 TRINITY_DN26917_c0_g1~~TRINITY_DN26917_c0_g1_i1.p1  ORF type:complete len:166 (-),score=40.89 TRINITY_DN26917_c0_g1_i1:33-482(-)
MADEIEHIDVAELIVNCQNDLWNSRKFKVIDDFFSEDVAAIYPDLNHQNGVQTSGKEDFKKNFVLPLFSAFPDLKFISLEVVSDNRTAIAQRWTLIGTFEKEYKGIQPNHKKVTWQGISILHINQEGKINMIRSLYDQKPFLEALQQKE